MKNMPFGEKLSNGPRSGGKKIFFSFEGGGGGGQILVGIICDISGFLGSLLKNTKEIT